MEVSKIKIRTPEKFASRFLSNYLAAGMGRMQKRDIDVLALYLLIADGQYSLPEDIFKAARDLKLTEARVRNLYQEVQLRYLQINEDEAKVELADLIEKKSFEIKGDRIVFIVRNPMLGQWFQEWVAAVEGFTDTSFNRNLVSIDQAVFLKVLQAIAVKDVPNLENEFRAFNKAKGREEKVDLFVKEFIKGAGNGLGGLTTSGLARVLRYLLGVPV